MTSMKLTIDTVYRKQSKDERIAELEASLAAAMAEVERLQKEMDAIVSLDELMVDKCQQIKAENERLRRIIRKAEWPNRVSSPSDHWRSCAVCGKDEYEGHTEDCPFYQWEGGAQ